MNTVICAWHPEGAPGRVLTPGDPNGPISHGICADCHARVLREQAYQRVSTHEPSIAQEAA